MGDHGCNIALMLESDYIFFFPLKTKENGCKTIQAHSDRESRPCFTASGTNTTCGIFFRGITLSHSVSFLLPFGLALQMVPTLNILYILRDLDT